MKPKFVHIAYIFKFLLSAVYVFTIPFKLFFFVPFSVIELFHHTLNSICGISYPYIVYMCIPDVVNEATRHIHYALYAMCRVCTSSSRKHMLPKTNN